jgi:prevent-host-death family protein
MEIKASEFKAKCLQLMDSVAASGEALVITKNGVPVAKLVPAREKRSTLFGLHNGEITIRGNPIAPVDADWEAAH